MRTLQERELMSKEEENKREVDMQEKILQDAKELEQQRLNEAEAQLIRNQEEERLLRDYEAKQTQKKEEEEEMKTIASQDVEDLQT